MRYMMVAAAALLCFSSAAPVFAAAGPAELPPAGFSGQQYVDSRGCVFLRAGYGGRVTWVQRITATRKPLCGYPPTLGAHDVAVAEAPVAPVQVAPAAPVVVAAAPAPVVVKPAPVVVAQTAPAVVPRLAAPQPQVQLAFAAPAAPVVRAAPATHASGPKAGQIGCYTSAPVPMVVKLTNGGTAIVCTKGDGSMDGWRPPVYPAGAPVGASLGYGTVDAYKLTPGGAVVTAAGVSVANPNPAPPAGYAAAWKDDRLNPQRGLRTAAKAATAAAAPAKAKTAVSTSSNPAASGSFYVQVGTFGVPANATGAASTLRAAGLPAAKGKMTKGGKALEVVYAGPFGSQAEAQAALTTARGAGFGDAFIR